MALLTTPGDLACFTDDVKVERGCYNRLWTRCGLGAGGRVLVGPCTPRWHATWLAIGKAARLSQRKVFVFGVESHLEWQDFWDGIGSEWAFAGNELADGLAFRAATNVTISEQDQLRVSHLRGCTHLVHRRIAAATARTQPAEGAKGRPFGPISLVSFCFLTLRIGGPIDQDITDFEVRTAKSES